MANPTLLEMPIARDGAKNSIPSTTSPTTGLLSQQYGWQDINSMPVQQGGKAPSRLDFNGVLNLLSKILFYAQKGFTFEYDETQDYYAKCIVLDPTNGKMYRAKNDVSASATHPSADSTNWELFDLLTLLANYLPLSGGHMTGITIDRNVDNSALLLCGGKSTSNIGSFLQLDGGNSQQSWNTDGGSFILSTQGASNEQYVLRGGKNLLQWGKYNPNPQAIYDLGGSSIVAINLAENGYIKYAKGLIYQWGRANAIGSGVQTVNYNINFPTGCKNLQVRESDNRLVNVVTKADKISINNQTGYDLNFDWFAVGY